MFTYKNYILIIMNYFIQAGNKKESDRKQARQRPYAVFGNDSNLLIVFYVQIMPDDFVMQLHRF